MNKFTTLAIFRERNKPKEVPIGNYFISLKRNKRTACKILRKFTDKNIGHFVLKGDKVKLNFLPTGYVDCYIVKSGSNDILVGGLPLYKLIQ